jgi:hypothetical protein
MSDTYPHLIFTPQVAKVNLQSSEKKPEDPYRPLKYGPRACSDLDHSNEMNHKSQLEH